jgi:hypothetical protein
MGDFENEAAATRNVDEVRNRIAGAQRQGLVDFLPKEVWEPGLQMGLIRPQELAKNASFQRENGDKEADKRQALIDLLATRRQPDGSLAFDAMSATRFAGMSLPQLEMQAKIMEANEKAAAVRAEQAQQQAALTAQAQSLGMQPGAYGMLTPSQRGEEALNRARFEQNVQDAMMGNRNMSRAEAEAFVRQRTGGFVNQENFDQSQRTPGTGATASQMYAMAKDAYERAEMDFRAVMGQDDPKKPLQTLPQATAADAYSPVLRTAMKIASPASQLAQLFLKDPSPSPEQSAAWQKLQDAKARLDSFVQTGAPAPAGGAAPAVATPAFQPADQSEAALLAAFKSRTGRDADLTNDADLQVMEQIEASMRQPR